MMKKKPVMSEEDYLLKLADRNYDETGKFVPNPVPVAPPVGYQKTPSMVEIVRNMVRSEKLAEEARSAGMETFEESEDFDIGDEPEDLRSGWENDFDPPISELQAAIADHKKTQPASVGDEGAAGGSPGAEAPQE